MVVNPKQASILVGAAAATTFCTAVASVIGIVPRFAEETSVRTRGTAVAAELAWMDREAEVVQELLPAEAAPTTTTTTTVVAVPATETTVAPLTTAVAPRIVETAPEAPVPEPVAAEVVPAVEPVAALPARRVPSPAEVQQAIRGMEQFVTFKSGLFGLIAEVPTPTVAQVNELGDKVCTAFDEGQTVEQVKASGMAMAADNPWVKISGAGADYVVKTAVTLYCPGYADKLA